MIKSNMNKNQVLSNIKSLESKDVEVEFDEGRNKIITFIGKLTGVYPALFTITPFDKSFKGKTSYSYSEYMCGRVKLKEIENNLTER